MNVELESEVLYSYYIKFFILCNNYLGCILVIEIIHLLINNFLQGFNSTFLVRFYNLSRNNFLPDLFFTILAFKYYG